MASEVSRAFDLEHGKISFVLKDSFGKESYHTVYVSGVEDVEADVAKRLEELDAQAAVIRERMKKAGWVDSSSSR